MKSHKVTSQAQFFLQRILAVQCLSVSWRHPDIHIGLHCGVGINSDRIFDLSRIAALGIIFYLIMGIAIH
jgi:hypothetical protein